MKEKIWEFMKKAFKEYSYSPKMMLAVHSIVIIVLALILGSQLPEEETLSLENASIIDSATLKEPVKKKTEAVVTDSVAEIDPITVKVNELLTTYKAKNFDDLEYEFTYDLQNDLVGKTVLFYAFISDIYKEGKDVYIKALKTKMNRNYYLKVKCDTASARILRNNGLFSYFLVKVSAAEKVFINTASIKSRAKSPDKDARTTSIPDKETVLITGKCLATIKQKNKL